MNKTNEALPMLKRSTLKLLLTEKMEYKNGKKRSISFTYNSVFLDSDVNPNFGRHNNLNTIGKLVELLFEDDTLPIAEKYKLEELLPSFELPLETFLWALMFLTTGWLYAPRHEKELTKASIDGLIWGRNELFWAVRPDVKNAYFIDLLRPATLKNLTHIVRNRIEKAEIESPDLKAKMIYSVLIGTMQQFYSKLPPRCLLESPHKSREGTAVKREMAKNRKTASLAKASEELFEI